MAAVRVRPLFLRLTLSLVTGVIFVCWSELAFWARPFAGTAPAEMIPTTLAYSIAAYLFLAILSRFQARSAEAVFLAGALFGWFVEGVIVQTMYEDLPLSLSFTGLAWHASITVMVGWRLLPRVLAEGRLLPRIGLTGALGIAFGLWSMTWWSETPPATPVFRYAAYALVITALLAAAYALASRLGRIRFEPSRFEWVAVAVLVLTYFAMVTIPAAPVSVVLLPTLAAVVLVGLRRLRPDPLLTEAEPLAGQPIRLPRLGILVLIPLAGSLTYAAGQAAGAQWPTAIALYLVMTPLGFVLLARSLWIAFRHPAWRALAVSQRQP